MSDLLERLDGPKEESEVATAVHVPGYSVNEADVSESKTLFFTQFTRDCADLCLQRDGRCFRSYKQRSGKGSVTVKKKGTFAALQQQSQRAGIRSLVSDKAPSRTFLGFSVKELQRKECHKLEKKPKWNKALQDFHRVTVLRDQNSQVEHQRARLKIKPRLPPLRRGSVMKQYPRQCRVTVPQFSDNDVVLELTKDSVSDIPNIVTHKRPRDLSKVDFADARKASLIVVDEQLRSSNLDREA